MVGHFGDGDDPPGAVGGPPQMHDGIDGGGHMVPDRLHSQALIGGRGQRGQAAQSVDRAVGVHCGEAPGVARVQGVQQIQRLRAPHLSHHQPVGTHPQRVAHEVADRHRPSTLAGLGPGLQPHHMGMLQLQLGGVLDGDDPLTVAHPAGQGVEQGGLARSRATADDEIGPPVHQLLEQSHHRRAREHLEGHVGHHEAANRHIGAVDRHRRDGHMDPGAVGQATVHAGGQLIDPAAQRGHDPLNDQVDRGPVQRHPAPAHRAAPLDPHRTRSVDHHLAHRRVGEQRLQGAQAMHPGRDPGHHVVEHMRRGEGGQSTDDARYVHRRHRALGHRVDHPAMHGLHQCGGAVGGGAVGGSGAGWAGRVAARSRPVSRRGAAGHAGSSKRRSGGGSMLTMVPASTDRATRGSQATRFTLEAPTAADTSRTRRARPGSSTRTTQS